MEAPQGPKDHCPGKMGINGAVKGLGGNMGGPQNSPQNAIILIRITPNRVPPIFGQALIRGFMFVWRQIAG